MFPVINCFRQTYSSLNMAESMLIRMEINGQDRDGVKVRGIGGDW